MKQKLTWQALVCIASVAGTHAGQNVLLAQPPASAQPSGGSQATGDGYIRTSLYVPADDGVKLAVDVYRPAPAGALDTSRLPVIVTQSRGEARQSGRASGDLLALVRHGYVWVAMDRRGNGASFGTSNGFVTPRDGLDEKAVIDWAAAQPWSNGETATYGASNHGLEQFVVAATGPASLRSMAPGYASPVFFDIMFPNGSSNLPPKFLMPSSAPCAAPTPMGAPVDDDSAPYPMAKTAAAEHRCNLGLLDEFPAGIFRDDANKAVGFSPGLSDPLMHFETMRKLKGSIYQFAGWYDASVTEQLRAWAVLGGKIVIGPYVHVNYTSSFPSSTLDTTAEHIRWFDASLKNRENGMLAEPPIRYYTMNAPAGSEWRFAATWPLPEQTMQTLYLAEPGSATVASKHDGSLASKAPAAGAIAYTADYSVKAFGGKYNRLVRFYDGDMRKDFDEKALTFTTTALISNTQVTGIPLLDVWVKSDAKDFNVFAFLEDVDEHGISTAVTDGVLRASRRNIATPPWGDEGLGLPYHRDFRADDQPLEPGKPVEMKFELYATSYVFRAGHRIRVSVTNAIGDSSSPEPGWVEHPAHTDFLVGAGFPSALQLPVIPVNSSAYRGEVTMQGKAEPAEMVVGTQSVYLKVGEHWRSFPVVKRSTKAADTRMTVRIDGASGIVTTTGTTRLFKATLHSAHLNFQGSGSE